MDYFKKRCRDLLGPSKHIEARVKSAKSEGAGLFSNIDLFSDEEGGFESARVNEHTNEDGKTVLLVKDYR